MGAVPVTLTGMMSHADGSTENVTFVGLASLTGFGVGGGPILPPDQPPGTQPPGTPIHPIWGPPGFNPPGPGMPPGIWGGPIIPTPPLPPDVEVPPPGSPPVVVQGDHPVNPIVAPPYIVVNYPGVGQVLVPLPVPTTPAPAKK